MNAASETAASATVAHRALKGDLVDAIARVQAPLGFLSVYAGTDPAEPDRTRIELKNHCARIEGEHDGPESADSLADALQSVRAGVEEAVRGKFSVAGFVPIGGPVGDAIWVDLPGGVPTSVARSASPDALPLLAMIERFGESGVVTVSRDQLAVYEWARGALEELERQTVDVDTASWRDTDGPFNAVAAGRSGGSGQAAMSTVGSIDAYEQKLDDATVAKLAGVAAPLIDRHSLDRRWERLIWFGDAAVVASVRASLRQDGLVHVTGDEAQVLDESRETLVARVRGTLDTTWTQNSRATLQALRERRPADRAESVEETGTLAAQGRVEELAVMVPGDLTITDDRSDISDLLGDVVRQGGHVRALHTPGSDDVSIVASLRW